MTERMDDYAALPDHPDYVETFERIPTWEGVGYLNERQGYCP